MQINKDFSEFKKELIQLRPTHEICDLIINFLNQYLGSGKTGIFLWEEKSASFRIWPEGINPLESLRVFDPFLLHITEHDQLYYRADIDDTDFYKKYPAEATDARRIFHASQARLLVPLVLNESLIGMIFIGGDATTELKSPFVQRIIRELASLSVMALSNAIFYERLQGILSNLEEQVEERTRELKEAQSQLIQNEKMAMLGVMVAGIAHEVNTPASVIQGSSENIELNLVSVLWNLQIVRGILDEENLARFMRLIRTLGIRVSSQKTKGIVREAFKRKRELSAFLESQGIFLSKKFADLFVENGLFGNHEADKTDASHFARSSFGKPLIRILKPLEAEAEQILLNFLSDVINTARNIKNIREAIRNIIRIVKALKHYSHLDQGEMDETDINESIENTLIVLSSILKGNVSVEEHYGEIPRVLASPDELGQVWTNLINNAYQAMKETSHPKVVISTFVDTQDKQDRVVVEIRDNGPGIPPELQAKIWDPFFTTKDQGEGTGLGLGIVHGIIEKHNARIELYESSPRGTAFRIYFPPLSDDGKVQVSTEAV